MSEHRQRLVQGERVNPVSPVHLWKSPERGDARLLVVTHLDVYGAIHECSMSALPNETGGFLLGYVGEDARTRSWIVEIDEMVPIEPSSQTPVHFSFSWQDVDGVRNYRDSRNKALVGWYHTHPNMGIFLSNTDMNETHRILFSDAFQVALVYDPVARRAGFFYWESPQVIDVSAAPWREFFLDLEPESRPNPGIQAFENL